MASLPGSEALDRLPDELEGDGRRDDDLGELLALAVVLLRYGELCELRRGDLDLVAGKLLVRRSFTKGQVKTPKSGKPREIPLSPVKSVSTFRAAGGFGRSVGTTSDAYSGERRHSSTRGGRGSGGGGRGSGACQVSIQNSGPPGVAVSIRLCLPEGQSLSYAARPLAALGIKLG